VVWVRGAAPRPAATAFPSPPSRRCLQTRDAADVEALQAKDYANVKDPSLLRFLVDLRGEEVDNKQMRDDLITLLIAGHETTAAVLTWSVFALNQHAAWGLISPRSAPSQT